MLQESNGNINFVCFGFESKAGVGVEMEYIGNGAVNKKYVFIGLQVL